MLITIALTWIGFCFALFFVSIIVANTAFRRGQEEGYQAGYDAGKKGYPYGC